MRVDKPSPMISIILPTYNEAKTIQPLITRIKRVLSGYKIEIIVVDDNSKDKTPDIVKSMKRYTPELTLVSRSHISGLGSAIKDGLMSSSGDIAIVMDSDGQHDAGSIFQLISCLENPDYDLAIGSRFLNKNQYIGLSKKRKSGSVLANKIARYSLRGSYSYLTDYMAGFFALKLQPTYQYVEKVNVHGFKFLYELLSVSDGYLRAVEIPISLDDREHGVSKLDLANVWDFLISVLHSILLRMVPRRMISFGLVGLSGIGVQLLISYILLNIFLVTFIPAISLGVLASVCSNYCINNELTFRSQKLKGFFFVKGLIKFLLVSSLPMLANVSIASTVYGSHSENHLVAQLAGIALSYIWNYAASSKAVWNSP